ncbi:MAG: PspC domain-containing protein [Flavobacteriia bacterium]|nr:PspC domain-containing protein [Flavobacteriia bacterium]
MNKTININLAGIIFHMDEEAYERLTSYLRKLKAQFQSQDGGDEILMDIEARIAEIFTNRLDEKREVVSMADVDAVIEIMGQPEDYAEAEEEETESKTTSSTFEREYAGPKRLFRDSDDNILGGVASGLAHYFGTDPIWFRLAFIALTLIGASAGFWLYIILWIVVPEAKTTAQKLQMRGERINISNIEKSVKEELRGVGKAVENLGKDERIRKGGKRIGKTIEDIVDAIISVIGSIFRVVFKIVGVVLLFGGVIFLVIAFSAVVGYGVDINGANMGLSEASQYLALILPSGYGVSYIWLASGLTVVFPLVGLVVLGGRILFSYRMHNKMIMSIAGFTSFIGLIMWLVLGFATARDFDSHETIRDGYSLTQFDQETAIEVIAAEQNFDIKSHSRWGIDGDNIVVKAVEFDIRQTRTREQPYIEIVRKSQGASDDQAEELARNIEINVVSEGNRIIIDEYIQIAKGNKYRAQEVDVILYLPVGYSAYLSHSSKKIVHYIDNVKDIKGRHMIDHIWIMTEAGLSCADCPEDWEAREIESQDEWEDQWIEDAQEMDEQERSIPTRPTNEEELPTLPERGANAALNSVVITDYGARQKLI